MPAFLESFLEQIDTTQNRLIAWIVLAIISGALIFYTTRALMHRRARRKLHEAIAGCGAEFVHSVLVPDGMDGSLHVDYLLLTARGVVVIDLREVRGKIFGGDQMDEWTVMTGASRVTFPNPQHALFDRVASVKQLAGELQVEGRILFTRGGEFPKGLPRYTLMVDSLRNEFPALQSDTFTQVIDSYRPAWQSLCDALRPSPLRRERNLLAAIFLN
jgi:hypothetical protein